MVYSISGTNDGHRLSVNDLIKNPTIVPKRALKLLENQFIVDTVLRKGGGIPGGVAEYFESTPQFALGEPAIKDEFGEYKIITGQDGVPKAVRSINRGASILISEEMRRRNKMDVVTKRMTQLKNTMTRTWDYGFRNLLVAHPSIPTMPTTGAVPWSASTAKIRFDIIQAKKVISEATADVSRPDDFLGFTPDLMVISVNTATDIIGNENFSAIYQGGNLADKNLLYTGMMERQVLGLNVLAAPTWPDDIALICERGTLGFISEERPMRSTELYEDKPTETWRSDTSRIAAMAIDEPLAGVIIEGVGS